MTDRFVSADSHVVEPKDLWLTRMDKRFRDRAPRVDSQYQGDYYVIDGILPLPLGPDGAAIEQKIKQGEVEQFFDLRHENTRPGAWDPQARLADQDLDHVRAEVIYPGIWGGSFFRAPDPEYQRECIRVYNDWISEFNAAAPDRLLGVGLLPMKGPIEWSIEEAQRVTKKGIRSVLIAQDVPERPYCMSGDTYEPLWAALQDLGVPVALHIEFGTGEGLLQKTARVGFGRALNEAKTAIGTIGELIWSGIPQRYPKLRFVLAETGIGWIACLLTFMDHWWKDHHRWMEPKLAEPPSFYFRRQFWATFEDDRAGILTREMLNVDHLMWGADYPHCEGVFPYSREQIAKDFAGVPEDEVYKIVVSNAARLYGLE